MIYLPRDFWPRLVEHGYLTLGTLAIALLIALPLGLLISRWQRLQGPVLGLLGVLYTIPSLALLAFLVPFLGLGTAPTLTALVMYSLALLVRNVVVAFAGVSPAAVEAARGLGMTSGQIFWRVELPLALPVILAGMRITTLAIISLTTIAAWVGAGGLGQVIRNGELRDDNRLIVAGVGAVMALALLTDAFYRLIERLNTGYLHTPRRTRLLEQQVDEQAPIKLA
jgi:osmoprotectant transport system permease protein